MIIDNNYSTGDILPASWVVDVANEINSHSDEIANNATDLGKYLPLTGGTLSGGLTVGGSLQVNGDYVTGNYHRGIQNGTAAWPVYSMGSPHTGMYALTDDSLGLSALSVLGLRVHPSYVYAYNPVIAMNGTAAAPSYSFQTETSTGISLASTGHLRISTLGTERATLNSEYLYSGATYGYAMRHDTAGTLESPTYAFNGDPKTGMFRYTQNALGFSYGGKWAALFQEAALTFYRPCRAQDGKEGEPSWSFQYAPAVGFYLKSTANGTIGISGRLEGSISFRIADNIDTADILDRAEVSTMPTPDDDEDVTDDESVTVNEVVTALLSEVKELRQRIAELEAA